MTKVILFVDLDYFFAQLEEVENPSLRNKPVVVCVFSGRTQDSGVVSSANYVARSFGVKAGMPIKNAKRLLPDNAALIPVRMSHYGEFSRQIMNLLKSFGAPVGVESIDEAVMDITTLVDGDFAKAEDFGRSLKQKIREKFGLTCSVGIGPNRVVAKIAADTSKPDGLRTIRPEEVSQFLQTLPVRNLPGIGVKTEFMLTEQGVKTVGDLAKLSIEQLEKIFGPKKARHVYLASRGLLDEAVEERPPPKQVSKIVTLKRNTRDLDDVMTALSAAVGEASSRLESNGFTAMRIGLIAISSTLKTFTRQSEIRPGASPDEMIKVLRKLATDLFDKDKALVLRRVGVRFSELRPISGQTSLNVFSES